MKFTWIVLVAGLSFSSGPVLATNTNDQLSYKNSFENQNRDQSFLIGHNVTPTTSLPKKNIWTVGNYAMGVGLSDSLFLATSPWIWTSYNTANIHLKFIHSITNDLKIGFFSSYFESYDNAPFLKNNNADQVIHSTSIREASVSDTNRYQWKSASAHFLASYDFTRSVTTNFNAHFGYFWNDDFPYSIRMDPGRDSIRGQADLTTLTSVKIPDSDLTWSFEFGALGVNYVNPYLQLGSSFAYTDKDWLIQVGASYTVAFSEARYQTGWVPGRYDDRVHSTADGQAYSERYLQTALHPEVQFQFFF